MMGTVQSTPASGIMMRESCVSSRHATHAKHGWRAAWFGVLGACLTVIFDPSSLKAQQAVTAEKRHVVLDKARRALVRVELFLKTVPDDDGPGGMGETTSSQTLDQQLRQVVRFKKSIQIMGFALGSREVLVPDTGIQLRRIDRWEVTDSTGKRVEARTAALLRDAPALVIEPIDPGATWPTPEFSNDGVTATDLLTVVTPDWAPLDLKWLLRVSQVSPTAALDPSAGPTPFWIIGSLATGSVPTDPTTVGEVPAAAVSLIFNQAGDMLGAGLADRLLADRAVPPWRIEDLRSSSRIGCDELEQRQERLAEKVGASLYPVRVEFRRPRGGFQSFPDSELLGWAVSDRMLMVPWELYRQIAARIGRITVDVNGQEVEAELVGQMKDFSAVLLRLSDSAEPLAVHAPADRAGQLHTYRPNIAITVARRYGAKDLRVQYTRSLGLEYGYRNRQSPRFTPAPYIGSLIFDLDGDPVGLFARTRRPLEELELIQALSRQGTASNVSSVEFYDQKHLAEIVRNPAAAIDSRVVRRDEADQDRRAWLGVESSPLSKDLAESLGCRKETKDGSVGVMVSQVYAGSPAEKMGLRNGDVLLSLDMKERDQPLYLMAPRGGRGGGDGSQFPSGDGTPGGGRTPWPSQNNLVNGVLSLLGEGTDVQLSYWRDGSLQRATFQVEQAPPDQDSATQFKDEQIGITVKEVTYEVRAALRMKSDDAGVVVAKVESGTPAGRARINPHEVITAADGESIHSIKQFESIVQKAQQDKKEQIRLTVVDRGRSRFADLKLTP